MSARTCDIAACVAGYSRRLHAAIGTGHQVASPLGAWLLLALAGPASSGPDRDELADVLGCAIGTVKSRLSRARALLRDRLKDYRSEGGS